MDCVVASERRGKEARECHAGVVNLQVETQHACGTHLLLLAVNLSQL